MRILPFFTAVAVWAQAQTVVNGTQLHTILYTTTMGNAEPPQPVTTVFVTVIMPIEFEVWPHNNGSVTGAIISHWSAANTTSSLSKALTWILSGNRDLNIWTTTPPTLSLGGTKTHAATYTTTVSRSTDYNNLIMGRGHSEWTTTQWMTLFEEIGSAYPTTIVRTAFSHWEIFVTGGNEAVGFTHNRSVTVEYSMTTTMVLATATATPTPTLFV